MQAGISQDQESSSTDFDPGVNFFLEKKRVIREVHAGRFSGMSALDIPGRLGRSKGSGDLGRLWALNRLRGILPRTNYPDRVPELTIVDLCCGAGGLATGVKWACHAVGVRPVISLAVDVAKMARTVYKLNMCPLNLLAEDVANLVDYDLTEKYAASQPELVHPAFDRLIGRIDVVIAGPPCQGNSNFNNHTRRRDKRNELYVSTVAVAIALRAKVIIVENVTGVVNAQEHVVTRALTMLRVAGYRMGANEVVLNACDFGVAQRRKRHFLIAARKGVAGKTPSAQGLLVAPISTMDAISDLMDREGESPLDRAANLSDTNRRRIDFLFDNNEFDLPDGERPVCHREREHTYYDVYGRMFPDEPSQTLTTGFRSPGRGRYIHPVVRRGLTLREGARLQGFPDDYKWCKKESGLASNPTAGLIGDAVPPQLGYTVGLMGLALL